jgi:hypothetical protein
MARSRSSFGLIRALGGYYMQGPDSIVALTADTIITPDKHAGKLILINNSTLTITLPTINNEMEPITSGPGENPNTLNNTGISYDFLFITSSGTSTTILGNSSADLMMGGLLSVKDGLAGVHFHQPNGSSNYQIVMNGTTTGGVAGTRLKIQAAFTNRYFVEGTSIGTGTLATPFAG